MAGKHQIGGGFAVAGISIQIGAAKAGRLGADQAAAVLSLADDLVGAGGIDDHSCTGNGVFGRRRICRPEVFTDFGGNTQPGKLLAAQ